MALVQVLIPPNACRAEEFDAQLGGSSRGTAAALNPDMASLSSPLIALENNRLDDAGRGGFISVVPAPMNGSVIGPSNHPARRRTS